MDKAREYWSPNQEKFSKILKEAMSGYDDYDEVRVRPLDYSFLFEVSRSRPPRKAILKAIAGILIFCIAVVGTAVWINSTPANAERLKRVFHMLTNGMFTSDNEENHEAFLNESANIFRIETMDDLYKAKRFLPELLVPQFVPEECEFTSLEITKYLNENYVVQYHYAAGSKSIEINMQMTVGENPVPPQGVNVTQQGDLLMWQHLDGNGAGGVKGNVLINVTGDATIDEMFEILKNLL